MADCGALVLAYKPADHSGRNRAEPLEFTCPRCGIDFTVPEDELIFQSVPKDWLLARVRAAWPGVARKRQQRPSTFTYKGVKSQ
jgi:hypothetical protein